MTPAAVGIETPTATIIFRLIEYVVRMTPAAVGIETLSQLATANSVSELREFE